MSLLDLNGIKKLFTKGMQYSKKQFSSIIFARDDALSDYQVSLANKAQTLTELMDAIWIGNLNATWKTCFDSPKKICDGCELSYTPVQFGVGHTGWYFFFGVAGKLCYNLSFFRMEIAPPGVVDFDKSEAVRWLVLGGFGTTVSASDIKPVWHSIQHEWIYMKYTENSYSTFSLVGEGENIKAALSSPVPMQFSISLEFTDTENLKHIVNIGLSANTPPAGNYPGACNCGFGLGTFYYSYPDLSTSITADTLPIQTGTGWVDHQLLKGGLLNSTYMQALQSVGNALSKKAASGWLWFAIQDFESGLQYMFMHFFTKNFYQYDIKLNDTIDLQLINVYKKGVPYFMPTEAEMNAKDTRVVLLETVYSPVANMHLPAKYSITLPGGKKTILQIATAPNVYPAAFAPYETPAYLFDSTGSQIGVGLIEANLYFTNEMMAKRVIAQAGGNPDNKEEFDIVYNTLEKKQSLGRKILAFFILLIPVWLFILCGIFTLYKKDDRANRLVISVVVLFLIYLGVIIGDKK